MKITIPYTPRCFQRRIHDNLKRFNVLVVHRRAGKTVCLINELIKQCILCKKPDPRFAYFAPTYSDAKDIAWTCLKNYTENIPGIKKNETELFIELPNKGRIKLYGCDTPKYAQKLRGRYFDGVVLDEYSILPPSLYVEILRPALLDREGFVIMSGTPYGDNHFKEIYDYAETDNSWFSTLLTAYETNVLSHEQIEKEREFYSRQALEDKFNQEFLCSFNSFIHGAIFKNNLEQCYADERICRVTYDRNLKVYTFWDLGQNDATAIWFVQFFGNEIRLIDYYENVGEPLDFYFKILEEKNYDYACHYFPHDIKTKFQGGASIVSREKYLIEKNINYKVVERARAKSEDIDIARRTFINCFFDEEKCKQGLNCLKNYCYEWDEMNRVFKKSPKHDWASNGSDSFMYMAKTALQIKTERQNKKKVVNLNDYIKINPNARAYS